MILEQYRGYLAGKISTLEELLENAVDSADIAKYQAQIDILQTLEVESSMFED